MNTDTTNQHKTAGNIFAFSPKLYRDRGRPREEEFLAFAAEHGYTALKLSSWLPSNESHLCVIPPGKDQLKRDRSMGPKLTIPDILIGKSGTSFLVEVKDKSAGEDGCFTIDCHQFHHLCELEVRLGLLGLLAYFDQSREEGTWCLATLNHLSFHRLDFEERTLRNGTGQSKPYYAIPATLFTEGNEFLTKGRALRSAFGFISRTEDEKSFVRVSY